MSSTISEAITNAQTRRESTYTKLSGLGATIPTTKNLDNIPSTIDSLFKKPWLPVNYIAASGTQYIDTGITASNNTDMEIKLYKTASTTFPHVIFNANGTRYGFLGDNKGYFRLDYNSSVTASTTAFNNNTAYVVKIDNGNFIVNGTTLLTGSGTFSPAGTLTLFRPRYSGSVSSDTSWSYKGRVYYLKMYESDVLTRYFIPCILCQAIAASQDSQNTARSIGAIGLWDLVNDKFYANAGTGTFTAG